MLYFNQPRHASISEASCGPERPCLKAFAELMNLVRYALKFRKSFYVLAVLMLLAGIGSIAVAPKDVLPSVDIPVVVVV